MRLPVPFEDSYDSTRVDYDDQRKVNMYPHSKRGWRQVAGKTDFAANAGPTPQYSSAKSYSPGIIPNGIAFNADGTKMYLTSGSVTTEMREYVLSTAYDPSTATLNYTLTLDHTTPVAEDLAFFNSGLNFLVLDADGSGYEYTLSTAYDLSTAAWSTDSYDFTSEGADPSGIAIDATGTYLLMVDTNGSSSAAYQYAMSTANDFSTISYSSLTVSVIVNDYFNETVPSSVDWGPDGSSMFIIGNNYKSLGRFDMSTAYDISTATYANAVSVRSRFSSSTLTQAVWADSGNLLVIGAGNDVAVWTAESYSLGGENFSEPVFVQNDTSAASSASQCAIDMNADGTKLYTMDFGNDQVDEWALSTAYDLSTISGPTSYTFAYVATPVPNRGLRWGDSGTKLYVLDNSTDLTYQYTASTAYDVSSLSYASKSFANTGSNPTGIGFNSDGSRLAWMDASEIVYMGTLSTPWDLATASADAGNTFNATGDIGAITRGFEMKPDGTRFYISTLGSVYEFSMSTAYDLTTSTLVGSFNPVARSPNGWTGLRFVRDGAMLYVNDQSTPSTVSEWSMVNAYSIASTSTGTTDTVRGAINMDSVPYAVVGPTLFSFASDGTATSIGTIAGTARVVMETDGVQLVITTGTDGGTIYVYTTAAGLVTITDANIEDTARSSAYLDLAFYFDQADGKLIASDNNDATTFSTDDILEAESFADDIIRMFAHNQLLYAFGQSSTEVYYTSGVGRPPIERQQVIERGIVGTHAIASIDDTIFFVDQFTRPNMMSGLEYQPIYTPAIAERWGSYSTTSDCFVNAYSYNQQTFVDFVFPTEDDSWTYHVGSGKWFSAQNTSGNRTDFAAYVQVYDKVLSFSRSAAKVLQFSESAYKEVNDTITRTVDSGVVTTEIFGEASILGEDMICNSLKITVESTAAATLTVTLSKDGGAFGQSRTITVGAGVETRELNRWGKFREGIFRITTTSNAGVDIASLSGDFEVLDA